MKKILAALAAVLVVGTAHAQRIYNQAELDAMLAPIALQPDGVVSQILIAATYPEQVAEAARWSRANPHLSGDAAVRACKTSHGIRRSSAGRLSPICSRAWTRARSGCATWARHS